MIFEYYPTMFSLSCFDFVWANVGKSAEKILDTLHHKYGFCMYNDRFFQEQIALISFEIANNFDKNDSNSVNMYNAIDEIAEYIRIYNAGQKDRDTL